MILLYRAGWCSHVTAYGLPGVPAAWVKLPQGAEAAVVRPPGKWNPQEKRLAARIEQEHFALAIVQNAGRCCVYA